MSATDGRVTADDVELIGDPDDEDDVERRRRVVKERRHYVLHACDATQMRYENALHSVHKLLLLYNSSLYISLNYDYL